MDMFRAHKFVIDAIRGRTVHFCGEVKPIVSNSSFEPIERVDDAPQESGNAGEVRLEPGRDAVDLATVRESEILEGNGTIPDAVVGPADVDFSCGPGHLGDSTLGRLFAPVDFSYLAGLAFDPFTPFRAFFFRVGGH